MTGDFFDRGDRVVINPGAPNEEFATVLSVNPLALAEGLIYEHLSAEPIASLGPDITDRDSDGLTGLQQINAGTSPEIFDTDGDGVGDGSELANGTDPLDPVSGMRMETRPRAGNGDGLRLAWQASEGQTYTLQRTERLSVPAWQPVRFVTADHPNMVLDIDDVLEGAGNRFFRLVYCLAIRMTKSTTIWALHQGGHGDFGPVGPGRHGERRWESKSCGPKGGAAQTLGAALRIARRASRPAKAIRRLARKIVALPVLLI